MPPFATWVSGSLLPFALLVSGCARPQQPAPPGTSASPESTKRAACPPTAPLQGLPPGTKPEQMRLDYWLARYDAGTLDEPLLRESDIAAYNATLGRSVDATLSQRDLLLPLERTAFAREVDERLQYMRSRLNSSRYVSRSGQPLAGRDREAFDIALPELKPELRVALDVVPLRCGPFQDGLYEKKPDGSPSLLYDRNACSSARSQEVVQLVATWPDGTRLARTRFALGWIASDAPLSPPIPDALATAFVRGERVRAAADTTLSDPEGRRYPLSKHATLPKLAEHTATLATQSGFITVASDTLEPTRRPLTRRALFTTAFQFLDSPYGFGDAANGRDCSRFQMDVFESFDLALPRHSGWQAQAGTTSIDVGGLSADEKFRLIDRAAAHGAVLLALPGHIMLYLGKDTAGVPMAIHALGEYAVPCPAGQGDTVVEVQRVVVSNLQLGEHSGRGALIDRITTLAIFGRERLDALPDDARVRPLPQAAPPSVCKDAESHRIFASPDRPNLTEPLRIIATTNAALKAPALWIYGPHNELHAVRQRRLGGPPYALWSRIEGAARGTYTAVFADGDQVLACKRVHVPGEPRSVGPDVGPVWPVTNEWANDTLALWSAFVEQLFDGSPDDEQTWTNLHSLLRDPERNLLLDHLGLGEDAALEIQPDCADLPFSLRAYFAWKLGLPFGYRQCSRGRPGSPPTCGSLLSNLQAASGGPSGSFPAFSVFLGRGIRWGVHSGTGRTHPEDSETDLYPVALERASLPPGTVYADPYGHVLMVAKWFPQGKEKDAYGILLGAEAQPDGTIGRRRFFPGSFLFDPSTTDSGAGFKQFRPLRYDAKTNTLVALRNDELKQTPPFAHFSLEQYQGTKDDFYDRVDRIINPAPLDPRARLTSLVDALEEAAKRRVLAVDNGEQYFARGGRGPIPMPDGYEIFETQGAWEDYATPSRDMRLLIAIDTVLALPKQLERAPDRFNLRPDEVPEASRALQTALDHELSARSITYTGSDGAARTLTLQQIRERATRLEAAYNPNDCVERRWGAPTGSPEQKACHRTAPQEQTARMEHYRNWFHLRTRPPRGAPR